MVASFQEHVVGYLHGQGAQGLAGGSAPDVFIHVKTGEGNAVKSRDAAGYHSIVTREMCEEAAKEMKATSHVIEDGWGHVELKHPECFKTKKQPDPKHAIGEAGYWHSIQEVHALMTEHEKKMRKEFDIVVFLRPDHHWKQNVDWWKNTKPSADFVGLGDVQKEKVSSVSCAHGHIW